LSSGDPFGPQYNGQYDYIALDAQDVSDDGVWFDTSNVRSATLTIDQLEAGGDIKVMASNAVNKPANDEDGVVELDFTATTTNPALLLFTEKPYRWRKVAKTAGGSPDKTTVMFHGLSR
jgi:hypothetical protein